MKQETNKDLLASRESLPARGAWVETHFAIVLDEDKLTVAPRKGSVG